MMTGEYSEPATSHFMQQVSRFNSCIIICSGTRTMLNTPHAARLIQQPILWAWCHQALQRWLAGLHIELIII